MARFSLCGDENNNEQDTNPSNDRPLRKKSRLNIRSKAAASTSKSPMALLDELDNLLGTNGEPGEESQIEPDSTTVSGDKSEEQQRSPSDREEENVHVPPRGGEKWQRFSSSSEEEELHLAGARIDGNSAPIGTGVTLTDPDLLDCPICLEPLSSHVYQCENGHLACESCCPKIRNRCPSCCLPIGYSRCRAVEKILESAKIPCQNVGHGCMEMISYSKKLDHENTCMYVPCSCPVSSCAYVGISKGLYKHFKLQHGYSAKQFSFNSSFFIARGQGEYVFLQERNENTLFILNTSFDVLGEILNVICLAPTSANKDFSYDLTAKVDETTFILQTLVDCTPEWIAGEPPAKNYIVIPRHLRGSGRFFSLQLIIRKKSSI